MGLWHSSAQALMSGVDAAADLVPAPDDTDSCIVQHPDWAQQGCSTWVSHGFHSHCLLPNPALDRTPTAGNTWQNVISKTFQDQ